MQDRLSAPSKGPACTELMLSTPNAASNPQQAIGQVTAYLQTHPGINAVMTLNNAIGTALVSSRPASKPKIATFDLNSGVQQDIKNGSMAFAIDQQQYLQGYLPIVFLVPVQQARTARPSAGNDRRQRAAAGRPRPTSARSRRRSPRDRTDARTTGRQTSVTGRGVGPPGWRPRDQPATQRTGR